MTAHRLSNNVLVVAGTFNPTPRIGKHQYPPLLDLFTGWWAVAGSCAGVTGQFHYN